MLRIIDELMARQPGTVERYDTDLIKSEMEYLGIPQESEIGLFLRRYYVPLQPAERHYDALADIEGPDSEMRIATDFAHSLYKLPENFVVLSNCESEGFYAYDKETQAVFDVDLGEIQGLINGSTAARWATFFDFLIWYMSGEGDTAVQASR